MTASVIYCAQSNNSQLTFPRPELDLLFLFTWIIFVITKVDRLPFEWNPVPRDTLQHTSVRMKPRVMRHITTHFNQYFTDILPFVQMQLVDCNCDCSFLVMWMKYQHDHQARSVFQTRILQGVLASMRKVI